MQELIKDYILKLEHRLDKIEHEHAFDSGCVSSPKSMKLLGQICALEDIIEELRLLNQNK